MKHADKMVALTYQRYSELVKTKKDTPNVNQTPPERGEDAPEQMPSDKTPSPVPPTVVTSDNQPDTDCGWKDTLDNDIILSLMPAYLEKGAIRLLNYISRVLSWNGLGEICVDGQIHSRTHIIDLLKDALLICKSKAPAGFEVFYSKLGERNIPLSLIPNKARHCHLKPASCVGTPELLASREKTPPIPVPKTSAWLRF